MTSIRRTVAELGRHIRVEPRIIRHWQKKGWITPVERLPNSNPAMAAGLFDYRQSGIAYHLSNLHRLGITNPEMFAAVSKLAARDVGKDICIHPGQVSALCVTFVSDFEGEIDELVANFRPILLLKGYVA